MHSAQVVEISCSVTRTRLTVTHLQASCMAASFTFVMKPRHCTEDFSCSVGIRELCASKLDGTEIKKAILPNNTAMKMS